MSNLSDYQELIQAQIPERPSELGQALNIILAAASMGCFLIGIILGQPQLRAGGGLGFVSTITVLMNIENKSQLIQARTEMNLEHILSTAIY